MLRSRDSRRCLVGLLVMLIIPGMFVYLHFTSSIGRVVGIFVGMMLGSIVAKLAKWWIAKGRE